MIDKVWKRSANDRQGLKTFDRTIDKVWKRSTKRSARWITIDRRSTEIENLAGHLCPAEVTIVAVQKKLLTVRTFFPHFTVVTSAGHKCLARFSVSVDRLSIVIHLADRFQTLSIVLSILFKPCRSSVDRFQTLSIVCHWLISNICVSFQPPSTACRSFFKFCRSFSNLVDRSVDRFQTLSIVCRSFSNLVDHLSIVFKPCRSSVID